MPRTYASAGQIDKSGALQNGYDLSETDVFPSIHEGITSIFKRIRPNKTWAFIAETLGLKEHAAKHRAANHRDYTIEELQILLHGEGGAEILEMLMADAEPQWWKALRINLKVSQALAAQAQWQQSFLALDNAPLDQPTRRKLKKVNDADRSLTATCSAKTTAAGFLHQDRDRSLAGSVAQTKTQAAVGGRR